MPFSQGYPLLPDLQGCPNDEEQVCHGEVCEVQEEALRELLAKEYDVRLDDSGADRAARDPVPHDISLKGQTPKLPVTGVQNHHVFSEQRPAPNLVPSIKPLVPEGKEQVWTFHYYNN